MAADELLQVVDRIATRIIGALHALIGIGYSENSEHFVYEVLIQGGDDDPIGTTYAGGIRFSAEAAFVCTSIQCGARNDNVGTVVGTDNLGPDAGDVDTFPDAPFLLEITESGSDRTFQSEAVDAAGCFSPFGGARGTLGRPRLFKPNSNVIFRLTSLKDPGAAVGYDYRIQLVGYKIYKPSEAQDFTVRLR